MVKKYLELSAFCGRTKTGRADFVQITVAPGWHPAMIVFVSDFLLVTSFEMVCQLSIEMPQFVHMADAKIENLWDRKWGIVLRYGSDRVAHCFGYYSEQIESQNK